MLEGDDRVWAVASGGTISREYEALKRIADTGAPTVLAGDLETVSAFGRPTQAYPMRWLQGAISSKSQAHRFAAQLASFRTNERTLQCLAAFEAASGVIDVQDFQALIDPGSGMIFANDPRGVTPARDSGIMRMRLAQWRVAMTPASPPSPSPAPAPSSATAHHSVPPPSAPSSSPVTLEFLHVDWDATFEQRAREGRVRALQQDELAGSFSSADIRRMRLMGERGFRDGTGKTWNLVHVNETTHVHYFEQA